MLTLPITWTRQPQTQTRINWSNPLTRGLGFVQCGNAAIDWTGNSLRTSGSGTPTTQAGAIGTARKYANSADYYSGNALIDNATTYTTLIYCNITAVATYAGLLAHTKDLSTTQGFATWQQDPGGGTPTFASWGGTGGVIAYNVSPSSITSAGNVLLGFSCISSSQWYAFKNASIVASGSNDATAATGAGYIKVAGSRDVNGITGQIYLACVWNRGLSVIEWQTLAANPWQLFAPLSKKIYFSSTVSSIKGFIPKQNIWNKQPLGVPAINYSNPISKGLILSTPIGIASGQVWDSTYYKRNSSSITSSAVSFVPTNQGTQLKFSGAQASGAVSFGTFDVFNGLNALTIEVNFSYTALGTLISKWNNNAQSVFLLAANTNNSILFAARDNTGIQVWTSANNVITTNTNYQLIFVLNGGTSALFYLNGVPYSFSTSPSSFTGLQPGTEILQYGRAVDSGGFAGTIGMVNIWTRALNQSECLARYNNPWQLFAPLKTNISYLTGGGNIFNDSITETISPNDSYSVAVTDNPSFTETITVSDSLAAAVTDTISLTETITVSDSIVGTATVNGSLTETVSVSDSLASTSTVNANITEIITASDSLSTAVTINASITETVTTSDSYTISNAPFEYFITESITVNDSLSATATINVSLTESVVLFDSYATNNVIVPGIGWSGVSNQVQTTPGCAIGVVADADKGYGEDVGGAGVIDTYSCLINPPVKQKYYIAMESSGYVLQEDGSKIELESN